MTFDVNHRFKKNKDILYKELESGPILIDPYRRVLIELNPTAAEIWRLIDGNHSASDIVNELEAIFDADGKTLAKDVTDFLKGLAMREAVL